MGWMYSGFPLLSRGCPLQLLKAKVVFNILGDSQRSDFVPKSLAFSEVNNQGGSDSS